MKSRISTGAVAGVIAAFPMGVLMQFLRIMTPFGEMTFLGMIMRVVGVGIVFALAFHLVVSALIGACFGWWFGKRVEGSTTGIIWGMLHGTIFWVLRVLILLPILMGIPVLAMLTRPAMHPTVLAGLVAQLLFGLVLGLTYAGIFPIPRSVPIEVKKPADVP